MAIDKSKLPPPREMPIDAAVEAAMSGDPDDPIYGNLDRRRKARNLTESQRRKMERDAARTRLALEVSPELKKRLADVSQSLQVPPSDLVELLLTLGLDAIAQGKLDVDEYKYHSRLPRYPYRLKIGLEAEDRDE